MTASEMILVTRRSRNNRTLRKYDIGQVVSLKPTGQATILRYGYNGEEHRCCLTGRSEMFLDPEDALGMIWLAERYIKSRNRDNYCTVFESRPKKQEDTWRLIIRYPDGGEDELNGKLEGSVKHLQIDLTKFLKMIFPGQKLMGFGFAPILMIDDNMNYLMDLRDMAYEDYVYWKELYKKKKEWDKIPEMNYQYDEYKKKYKAYWDSKGWYIN